MSEETKKNLKRNNVENKNQEKSGKIEEKVSEREIEKLRKELEEKEQEIKTLKNDISRLRSEFHNYKLALERETNQLVLRQKENMIFKLIDLKEDFERAMNHFNEESNPLIKGIRMIYKKLESILKEEGVEEIVPSVGELFDPFRDEVAETIESDAVEDMAILEVAEKGYKFSGKVIKPPRVIVAMKPKKPDNKKERAKDKE